MTKGGSVRSFEVLEEFVNGSWSLDIRSSHWGCKEDHRSISPCETKSFIERAFSPCKCVAAILRSGNAQYAHYQVLGEDGRLLRDDKIYIFGFDQDYHFVEAVMSEREAMRKIGVTLSEVNLYDLLDDVRNDCDDD